MQLSTARSINFCGDSFCGSSKKDSWTINLSEKLDATILGFGKGGAAHEHAIQSFDHTADFTIFCWTEASRIYHASYPLNFSSCESLRKENSVYEAGYQYFQHIHNLTHHRERQKRDLYWFDHEVLSQYEGIAISLWCYNKTYNFVNAHNFDLSPLKSISTRAQGTVNHMNKSANQLIAKKIFNHIRSLNV